MRILGIETTSRVFSAGIFDEGRLCTLSLETGNRLSELIAPNIQRALEACALNISQIDYFACGLGPGSFTGIRIGISIIKAFGWANKRPLVGISTLDILARAVREEGLIIPVIDAKRNMVYCSFYERSRNRIKKVRPEMLISVDEFLRRAGKNSIIFGDALLLWQGVFARKIKGARFLDRGYWYPQPHNLLALALKRIEAGKLSDAFGLKPIYLYPKECQIRENK